MSFLWAECPDMIQLVRLLDIDVLWHPSFSNLSPSQHRSLLDRLLSGQQSLDVLCVEGTIIRGPGGTGMYDVIGGRPRLVATRWFSCHFFPHADSVLAARCSLRARSAPLRSGRVRAQATARRATGCSGRASPITGRPGRCCRDRASCRRAPTRST